MPTRDTSGVRTTPTPTNKIDVSSIAAALQRNQTPTQINRADAVKSTGYNNYQDYSKAVNASMLATPKVNPINVQYDYYNDLMAAFMEQNERSRKAALDAIMSNLEAVKGTYKTQIDTIIDQYQGLIDENEVAKERTRRRIKENQANRGQLESGLGRQERLDLETSYDNKRADIKTARENAVNEINNLILQAEAEAKTNRANVENSYRNALASFQMSR